METNAGFITIDFCCGFYLKPVPCNTVESSNRWLCVVNTESLDIIKQSKTYKTCFQEQLLLIAAEQMLNMLNLC